MMPSIPPAVRRAYMATSLAVTVAMLWIPEWLHVEPLGVKVLASIGVAFVLCVAMLTPIERWRRRIAPESFRNGTTVLQQVAIKTLAFVFLAFAGRVIFAWIDAT